jgi:uncharacterized protein YndB with AHSA1/START domain/DNA-binding transcriptional ArsR family regulator
MSNHVQTGLDITFAALADPTRRAILERLAISEASVNELAKPFDLSQPAISKHLKVLERAGLIEKGRVAQRRPRRLVSKPLDEATAWLQGYRNPGTLQLTKPSDREIQMKRMFVFPRERVFAAFTEPELLKRWLFGKPGGTLAICEVALKAGDSFRYVWRDPDGSEMGMSAVCLEIRRPERIVAKEKWDQPWFPGAATVTIVLTEAGGVTTLTQTLRYQSQVARDMVLQTMIEHAMALGYERLAELLKSQTSEQEHKK